MLESIKISLIKLVNLSASLSIIFKNLFLVSKSSTYLKVSEKPLIDVNGVLSSWETLIAHSSQCGILLMNIFLNEWFV